MISKKIISLVLGCVLVVGMSSIFVLNQRNSENAKNLNNQVKNGLQVKTKTDKSVAELTEFLLAEPIMEDGKFSGKYSYTPSIISVGGNCDYRISIEATFDNWNFATGERDTGPGATTLDEYVAETIEDLKFIYKGETFTVRTVDDLRIESEKEPGRFYKFPTVLIENSKKSIKEYHSVVYMPKHKPTGEQEKNWVAHVRRSCGNLDDKGNATSKPLANDAFVEKDKMFKKVKIHEDISLCRKWYKPCEDPDAIALEKKQKRDESRADELLRLGETVYAWRRMNEGFPADLSELDSVDREILYRSSSSKTHYSPSDRVDPLDKGVYKYSYKIINDKQFKLNACFETEHQPSTENAGIVHTEIKRISSCNGWGTELTFTMFVQR